MRTISNSRLPTKSFLFSASSLSGKSFYLREFGRICPDEKVEKHLTQCILKLALLTREQDK